MSTFTYQRSFFTVLIACGVLFAASSAHADVLYEFGTTQKTDGQGFDASLVTAGQAANVSGPAASEVADGATGLDRFWNSEWDGFSLLGASETDASDLSDFDDEFFTFTIAADSGFTLNLTSLDFDSARGGSSGTRGFEVYADVNGNAITIADLLLNVDNETGTRTSPTARSIDLSDAEFQGINSITFRYYPLSTQPGGTVDFDGMTLNGEVMIPEPASMALLGLGAMALLIRPRKNTNPSDSKNFSTQH